MSIEDLAIIFRPKQVGEDVVLEPINCVSGYYDKNEDIFVDEKGYIYYHYSRIMPGRCFGIRTNINNVMTKYSSNDLKAIKTRHFNTFKNGTCYLEIVEHKFQLLFSKTGQISDAKVINDIDTLDTNVFSNTHTSTQKLEFDVKKTRESVKKEVVSQDNAVDKVITTIWRNINDKSKSGVSNILVSGTTGVGKTEIFRSISRQIDIPLYQCDANSFTAAGYVGKNVEEMLYGLLREANGDLVKANHGIIVIDEFDKIAGTGKNDEVSTTKVQDALLKMIEGAIYKIKYNDDTYNVYTSKITFVGVGAFSRVDRFKSNPIGFDRAETNKSNQLLDEDIIANGFEPELLGRFPVRVCLNTLEISDLFYITKNSELSYLRKEVDFFKSLGITVEYSDELLMNIAKKAYSLKCGARGITRVINDALEEVMMEISNGEIIYSYLELLPEIVEDKKRYVLIK